MVGSTLPVTLLYFDGCPLTPPVRKRLADAAEKLALHIEEIDLTHLAPDDPRLGYGSPTVLVDGRDVLGMPPSDGAGLTCRPYPNGLPSQDEWVELLQEAIAR